jgi:hypothetical protein
VAGLVERQADRGDASVHHVARRDDVGAGIDVTECRADEQLDRLVVHHVSVADDAAVAVVGVLAEADVRHQDELRRRVAQRAEPALHDAVRIPGAAPLVVLRLRDPEQDHRLDAETGELLPLRGERLQRVALHRRELLVGERLRRDEQREDHVVEVEPRLPHERAHAPARAQPPQPCRRERAHAGMVRASACVGLACGSLAAA